MPASRWMWPISSTVVVLPFVPVTATNSFGMSRHANSTSPRTGMPRARASAITGASAGTPGDLTTVRACSSSERPSLPSLESAPSARSPRAPSTCSTASPERARPTTRYGPPGSGGRGFTRVARARSRDRLLIDREPDRRAHARDDPEAQDDLRLRPPEDLEVVVDRGHQEDPLAKRLEREHLKQDRQRLQHEDPAEHDQQLLGLRHHCEARDRPAEPERSGVAHEDRRRERVEPQEADARADEAPREQRQVGLAGGDERDPDVGEQHDRRAAAREPVEPVGEVHRARRPRDHEIDQHRVEDAEVDRHVERAQPERVGQVGLLRGDPPQGQRDRDRDAELRPRAQAERAALDDLRVVVGEAEQRARDRGTENPDRAPVVVAQDQERDRDRREDDDPAHRGRAGLLVVALGALFADELAELAGAQERDELRRQEDADEQRGGARDEDLAHQARAFSSACATTSRPTPREPFTSTVSPGSSRSGTRSAAARASSAWTTSPSNASPMWRASAPTVTSTSTPAVRARAPASSWKRTSSGPSSSMSPRTATRRPFADAARSSSAARIDMGFAL